MALVALFTPCGLGMAMAVGTGDVLPNHSNETDPFAGKPLAGTTPDSPEKGLDQQGHAATGSAVENAELNESHIDDYVRKFKAYQFPLHTDILGKARQIKVDVKDPTDWQVGEAIMEATTLTKIASGHTISGGYCADGQETATITSTMLAKSDWKLFRKNATVMVGANLGFENGIADGTPLILFVESKDTNGIVVRALNGPFISASTHTVVVPEIPAGTVLYPMAPAMSESEVEVEPNNAMPTEELCYLQKKVCAITYTELFERIKKKADWSVQDIKDWNLEMFRRECTRSMLISAPAKFYKYNAKTGTETCYTEKGILRQMRLGYELSDGQMDFEDLIGIQAMLCGKYDTAEELTAYCGTKFVQRLLNIDFTKHKEYTVRNFKDEETKIKITSFESNFGVINFVHEYGLDDLGYSECAIIFGIDETKHFYYENNKTISIDHSKGEGGEVREARSQYYIKDDCVKLDTFNSMIVGPSALIGGYKLSALDAVIKSVNTLASLTGNAGDIVYLIADDTAGNKMGLYKHNGTSWVAYTGKDIYVA